MIASIVAYNPTDLFWVLTNHNDWAVSYPTSQISWSSANYRSGLGEIMDAVHALLPNCKIYLQSAVVDLNFETCTGSLSPYATNATQLWVLSFAVLVFLGLITGLFIPRRRVWIKAVRRGGKVHYEYAGLARGEDPRLDDAVAEIARKHSQLLGLNIRG